MCYRTLLLGLAQAALLALSGYWFSSLLLGYIHPVVSLPLLALVALAVSIAITWKYNQHWLESSGWEPKGMFAAKTIALALAMISGGIFQPDTYASIAGTTSDLTPRGLLIISASLTLVATAIKAGLEHDIHRPLD